MQKEIFTTDNLIFKFQIINWTKSNSVFTANSYQKTVSWAETWVPVKLQMHLQRFLLSLRGTGTERLTPAPTGPNRHRPEPDRS